MYALILSICMAPINAQGQVTGPDTCEEATILHRPTLAACIRDMDRNIEATKRSHLAPFDWAYSCEQESTK